MRELNAYLALLAMLNRQKQKTAKAMKLFIFASFQVIDGFEN
jgi:hypothetical protein